MKNHGRPVAVLVAALMSGSGPADAANWSITPKLYVAAGYNDNIRLVPEGGDNILETQLNPSASFAFATETSGIEGMASVNVRRFTGGTGPESSSRLNREDYDLNLNSHRNTPTGTLSLNADLSSNDTLDSSLDENGELTERATRIRFTVTPSWSLNLNERTRTDLAAQYSNVEFSDDATSDLVEYEYFVLQASITRALSERHEASLVSQYSEFTPETEQDSQTLSLSTGLSSRFTETFFTNVQVGVRRSVSDTLLASGFCVGALPGATFPDCEGGFPIGVPGTTFTGELKSTSPVYSASATRIFERTSVTLTLSRTSTPSNSGELLDTTSSTLSIIYGFSERFAGKLDFSLVQSESLNVIEGSRAVTDQDYLRVVPSLAWKLSRELSMQGSYNYIRSESRGGLDTATRNAVYLTFTYKPTKLSISR